MAAYAAHAIALGEQDPWVSKFIYQVSDTQNELFPCLMLALNVPIATKVVCFSRLLKCLRSLYGKQCGPRSDCSYMSSLFWVHTVCFYTYFICNVRQLFAADDLSRRHFQMLFFLCALKVNGDFCRLLLTFANSLDPDQDGQNVGPDLDPNSLTF